MKIIRTIIKIKLKKIWRHFAFSLKEFKSQKDIPSIQKVQQNTFKTLTQGANKRTHIVHTAQQKVWKISTEIRSEGRGKKHIQSLTLVLFKAAARHSLNSTVIQDSVTELSGGELTYMLILLSNKFCDCCRCAENLGGIPNRYSQLSWI